MAKRLERKRQSSEAGSDAPDAAALADQVHSTNQQRAIEERRPWSSH